MGIKKVLTTILLWICTVAIYIYALYFWYTFFREYAYIGRVPVTIGAIVIILLAEGLVLILFHTYHSIYKKKDIIVVAEPVEKKEEIKEKKEEIKNPRAIQNEKDKRVQRNYQKMLIDYKKELSPAEYKKFQEETKYDILLYDALMIIRDKKWTLLKEIEQEKGAHYASMLRKILD